MTRRVRSFSAARRATVRVCDREGTQHGQGLLLYVEGEGAVVLTCHHITAQLPPDSIYVSLPDEDGRLGAPRRAYYDEGRSHPHSDAVVLRLEGLEISEPPLLQRLDAAEYSGNLDVIGLTHLTPTSFDATLSASTPLEINVPTPDAILPPGSKYVIPQAFRLANPTYARQGISGAVIVRNGGVLGLAQSARKATDDRQAEAYLLPLSVWAEGWEALSTLLESFAGEAADPYDYALQDYLRAVRIFSADTPYLALDELLSGAKRTLHEIYVPLRGQPVTLPGASTRAEEGEESGAVPATGDETSPEQGPRPTEGETAKKTNTPPVLTLADTFRRASERPGQADLLLQGDAGLGKSTALRHITENAWSQPHLIGLSRPHLPIVIRLQVMAGERGGSIEEWLLNGLGHAGDMALERVPPAGFFNEWSTRENAPWLLLLDGLDEVAAEQRGEILRWIKALLQKLEGQHRVVMTSRPAGDEQYRELASKFTVCDVLPFDEDQQIDLATRWLPNAANDFLTKVKRISAGNLFREPLAMTPLLLTIAAAVYRRHGDLPESGEVELYGKFIDVLFEEARRRGLRDELGCEVFDVARGGLERLALAMTEHPTENTPAALVRVSTDFLREELGWAETRAETRGRQFVEVMSRRTGVLHLKGDTFHWVHPTIREHLAAQALDRQLRRPGNDYTKVIGEHLLDEGWYDVLWNLTFIHQDRQALIRWMSQEAREQFDAGAALLAYDCWQDSDPAVREALKHDIIGALVGGSGDSQSGLAARGRLLQYLTQIGRDVSGRLIALLDEYNGLQRQLLPEGNEEGRRPDIHTEPGKRIYAVFRLRANVIKVLGDIGDERAVEPLISLLNEEDRFDSFRWDITQDARRALRCIGLPVVGPLLARIADTALPNKVRVDCLTALGVVGIRTPAVTPVLDACIREGLRGDAKLLARSLRAARRLGDRAHQKHAISALASDDKDVVSEAASYLSRIPDIIGFTDLDRAFGRWQSNADDYFAREWTLRKLAAALLTTGNPKAKKVVVDFIKVGLEERGRLPQPEQTAQAADEAQLPSLASLLLRELVRRLNLPAPGFVVDKLVERLGEMWRPEQTRSLVRAAKQYGVETASNGGFAGRIVDICVGNRQESESERSSLRERLDRKDILRMMAKCQVSDFVAQAERLLSDAKFWMVSQVSDALWVVGDTSAENALFTALNNFTRPVPHADDPMPEEYDILRALGTCCTECGAQAVISYVRQNPNLSIYLPEEVLCTLVRRGVLEVNTLAQMAQDIKGTHEFVRRACVLALGYLGAPQFTSEFLAVLESETDEEARAYAAAFLGWAETDGGRAIEALRNVLTTTNKSFLARRAAQALARLKARDSLQDIERAAERFDSVGPAAGLLRAAARFRSRSTLELLKNLPAETRTQRELHTEADIIAAFGEFYQKDSSAREIVDAKLEYKQLPYDSGRQQIAVGVLAERNPNCLLRRATELYDQEHLEPSARTALINCVYRLGKSKRVDKTQLVEVMKRLLCEDDLSIREEAGERLQFVAAPLRIRIYDELCAMSSDWAQACAVYSLGFWDSDERPIERARFDVSPVVRKLASVAAAMRSKRPALRRLTRTFRKARGVARLSAYYSLLEQATDSHIDMLYLDTREGDLTRIYLRELRQGIERRVKEERKKRAKEEEDAICEKVRRVRFNQRP